MDVSVIIINYNTCEMTTRCVESVVAHTQGITYEIILVDNASTDGSQEYFTGAPRLTYFYNTENIGFGQANNVGAQEARGKYLFFLNSDTLLTGNAIRELFLFAEGCPETTLGALGTLLIDPAGKDIHSFSRFLTPGRIYRRLCEKMRLLEPYEKTIYRQVEKQGFAEVDQITGADLFIPKHVFEQVGGFDPDFFMYYEETDLQYRMKRRFLKRFILPIRRIIHLQGASFKGEGVSFSKYMLIRQSQSLYIRKNFQGIGKIHLRLLCALTGLKETAFNKSLNHREKLRAIGRLFT